MISANTTDLRRIYNFIKENGPSTRKEISKIITKKYYKKERIVEDSLAFMLYVNIIVEIGGYSKYSNECKKYDLSYKHQENNKENNYKS